MENDNRDTQHLPGVPTEDYWGGCPECGKTDGFVNVNCDHYFICQAHRTKWYVGSNLFSFWKFETEEEQRQNCERLGFSGFRHVEPVFPTATSQQDASGRLVGGRWLNPITQERLEKQPPGTEQIPTLSGMELKLTISPMEDLEEAKALINHASEDIRRATPILQARRTEWESWGATYSGDLSGWILPIHVFSGQVAEVLETLLTSARELQQWLAEWRLTTDLQKMRPPVTPDRR